MNAYVIILFYDNYFSSKLKSSNFKLIDRKFLTNLPVDKLKLIVTWKYDVMSLILQPFNTFDKREKSYNIFCLKIKK